MVAIITDISSYSKLFTRFIFSNTDLISNNLNAIVIIYQFTIKGLMIKNDE